METNLTDPQFPSAQTAQKWLKTMLLVRRFEERAGEMYGKAKIGGFLHLAIGEEATVVGAARALKKQDYLIATYRSHGHALARGTAPKHVMAELFGRVDGCCGGRGGSMHIFDLQNRFMGGYGIVGGNLPIAAGFALQSDYLGKDEATLCIFGDGASNQGTFGETLNIAALWRLPIVFLVTNNQFGMGTAIDRHSAVTDLHARGQGYGVPGVSCDGMDVVDVHATVSSALETARKARKPMLVEAVTYRFRGHSMADPEKYRSKEEVATWKERDPVRAFATKLENSGVLTSEQYEELDRNVIAEIDAAVEFANASPEPKISSLYDNIYAFGNQVQPGYIFDHPRQSAGQPAQLIKEDLTTGPTSPTKDLNQ